MPRRSRLVGLHLAAGHDQLLAPRRPDEAGQALRAAAAGDDAEQDLGLAEHGPLGRDAVVAGQRQLAAAPEGVATDGGDHEAGQHGQGVEGAVERGADRPRLLRTAELTDVGAGGEDPLATGHDDGARQVGRQRVDDLVQLPEQPGGEGVDLGVVERDHRHAVGALFEVDQFEVGHARNVTAPAGSGGLGADAAQHLVGGRPRVEPPTDHVGLEPLVVVALAQLPGARPRAATPRCCGAPRAGAVPVGARAARTSWRGPGGRPPPARARPPPPRAPPPSARSAAASSPRSDRSSISSRSRRVSSMPRRSALLMTKTSAISSSPALLA